MRRAVALAAAAACVAAAAADAAPQPRIVGRPLVLRQASSSGAFFQVRVRFDRAIRGGGAELTIRLEGAGTDAQPVAFGDRSGHCYAGVVGNDFDAPGLRGVSVGSRVDVVFRAPGMSPRRRSVVVSAARTDVGVLGCGRRRQ